MLFSKQVTKMYNARLLHRFDDTGLFHYYQYTDFPGLVAKPYPFRSSLGLHLDGFFYFYPGNEEAPLLVFDHGMGCGHRAYMVEIEKLCREGFRVYSYDHTGCRHSEGEHIRGLSQSLRDLDDAIGALLSDPEIDTHGLSVMGHSWGGFAAMNILSYRKEVERVVAISGFASVSKMLTQSLPFPLSLYHSELLLLEMEANPGYAEVDAAETLAKTDARVLLIHSDDDQIVSCKLHFDPLCRVLSDRENIRFLRLHGKKHNPVYTPDGVTYFYAAAKEIEKKGRKCRTDEEKAALRTSFDWGRITAQDETVWAEILKTLKD